VFEMEAIGQAGGGIHRAEAGQGRMGFGQGARLLIGLLMLELEALLQLLQFFEAALPLADVQGHGTSKGTGWR